jgi:hypothetical protein
MEQERAGIIRWINRDIYKLLLQYILRALRSQFDVTKPLGEWPRYRGYQHKRLHPVFKYFAKHALLTVFAFHNIVSQHPGVRLNVCLCGKLFAQPLGHLIGGKQKFKCQLVHFDAHTYVFCCVDCTKRCPRRHCSEQILIGMESCIFCERELEMMQNANVRIEWLKKQKVPF